MPSPRRLLWVALLLAFAGGGAGALFSGGSRASAGAAVHGNGRSPPNRELAYLVAAGLPLRCGGHRGHDLALTFDDGPGPDTALTLRILRRARARATFFLVGRNLARFPAYLPRAERARGAVGDHTWNHFDLLDLSPRLIREEIARTQRALAEASGAPVRLFRPPYGAHDATVDREVRSLGMLDVLWSIDTRDAEGAPWYQIAATTERLARPGAIVLLHENHGQTIRALKYGLLPWLRRHDYKLVSIPQLLAVDPPTTRQLRAGYRGCRRAAART